MTTAHRLLRLGAQAALLVVILAAASARSQPLDRVLDGSSPAKLETSVALLQNDLQGSRREELDVALAMIWMNRTANSGDLDGDGNFDVDDIVVAEMQLRLGEDHPAAWTVASAIERTAQLGAQHRGCAGMRHSRARRGVQLAVEHLGYVVIGNATKIVVRSPFLQGRRGHGAIPPELACALGAAGRFG